MHEQMSDWEKPGVFPMITNRGVSALLTDNGLQFMFYVGRSGKAARVN